MIPKRADKNAAFQANFGTQFQLNASMGDSPDDLSLLSHATTPLTLNNTAAVVQQCVQRHHGFISQHNSHQGTIEALDHLLKN